MARVVRQIMNPELLSFRPDVRAEDALDAILDFGVTAAPVLDDERRPIGVTSLRDLVRGDRASHVSSPALSVSSDTPIEEAARILAESGRHHLVVVGGDGRAVGMVSSLDLLRAVLGLPATYPSTFPHHDAELGVSWTNVTVFDGEDADVCPDGPGVLVLSIGGLGRNDCDLWAEASACLPARLVELLEIPQTDQPALERILKRRDLRFRCALVSDPMERDAVVRRLRARIDRAPLPHDNPAIE